MHVTPRGAHLHPTAFLTKASNFTTFHKRHTYIPAALAGLFSDGTWEYSTSATFGVDCGCDDDAVSPVPSPTEPPVAETPAPVPALTDPPLLDTTPAPVPAPTEPPVVDTTPAPVPAPTEPPVVETPAPTPGSRGFPSTTPAPSASANPPTPAAGGDCAAGEGLGVTSIAYPLLEGCLEETTLFTGGELEYMSGTGLIVALALDETSTVVRILCFLFSRGLSVL